MSKLILANCDASAAMASSLLWACPTLRLVIAHGTKGRSQPCLGSLANGCLQSDVWTYPIAVGGIAFLFTISMTIPFAAILIGAIVVRRDRWIEIVLLASLGSSTGGVLLYLVFHHFGWDQITALYPSLAESQAWFDATKWVSAYGTWALLVFAASPFPQMPALIFTAVTQLPVLDVYLALLVGKLLKFSVYGWLAARFPSLAIRFLRFIGFNWNE